MGQAFRQSMEAAIWEVRAVPFVGMIAGLMLIDRTHRGGLGIAAGLMGIV
jgi:hypothetical protein